LDIGKNVHAAGAYAGFELRPVIDPFAVRSDRAGFERVTGVIDGLLACGAYGRVVLGHEPTGIYHEAWARALLERYADHREGRATPPLDYRFLNPLLSKRKREELNNGRKRKTDFIDLEAIAYCLRDGLGQPAFLATDRELRLQLWGEAYRRNHQERRRLTLPLLTQLDRLWPGMVVNVKRFRKMHPKLEVPVPLVLSKPLERERVRTILTHCPNPHDFLALGQAGIQTFYRTHIGRCGPAIARQAYQLVQNALLPPPEVAALLAEHLQADFDRYLALERDFDTLTQQAESLVPDSSAAVLDTFPGIGCVLAARYRSAELTAKPGSPRPSPTLHPRRRGVEPGRARSHPRAKRRLPSRRSHLAQRRPRPARHPFPDRPPHRPPCPGHRPGQAARFGAWHGRCGRHPARRPQGQPHLSLLALPPGAV
jgi:hypothetical protein